METEKVILLTITTMMMIAGTAHAQSTVTAQGGNITPLSILSTSDTEFWQGIPGRVNFIGPLSPTNINATGGDINRTDIDIPSPCTNPLSVKGFILFSNSSTPPAGLTAGNLTYLDSWMGNPESDSATRTYTDFQTYNIGGSINSQGELSLDPTLRKNLPSGTSDHIGKGDYYIQLLDKSNEVLFERKFTPDQIADYEKAATLRLPLTK